MDHWRNKLARLAQYILVHKTPTNIFSLWRSTLPRLCRARQKMHTLKIVKKKTSKWSDFFFLPIMCYFKRNLQEVKDINLDKDDPVMNHMIIKENCSAIIWSHKSWTTLRWMNSLPSYSNNFLLIGLAVLSRCGPAVTL